MILFEWSIDALRRGKTWTISIFLLGYAFLITRYSLIISLGKEYRRQNPLVGIWSKQFTIFDYSSKSYKNHRSVFRGISYFETILLYYFYFLRHYNIKMFCSNYIVIRTKVHWLNHRNLQYQIGSSNNDIFILIYLRKHVLMFHNIVYTTIHYTNDIHYYNYHHRDSSQNPLYFFSRRPYTVTDQSFYFTSCNRNFQILRQINSPASELTTFLVVVHL